MVRGVRHVVSEGIRDGSSLLIVRTDRIFTRSVELVPSDARMFQHIAEDSHDLTTVRGNFYYLRTVIVTAAVYWGFNSRLCLAANLSF